MRFFQDLHTHLNRDRDLTGKWDRIIMVTSMGMFLDAIDEEQIEWFILLFSTEKEEKCKFDCYGF